MRIAIEALGIARSGGARSFALNLLASLFELDPSNQYWVLLEQAEYRLGPFPTVRQIAVRRRGRFSARLWAQLALPGFVRRNRIDLLHHVKDQGLLFPPCPSLVTVYDLAARLHPSLFPLADALYQRLALPTVLHRASHIIAISHRTALDLKHTLGVPPTKVTVVPPPLDPAYQPPSQPPNPLPEPFILHVGGLSRKKNTLTLVQAYAQLKGQGARERLVLIGPERDAAGAIAVKAAIQELDLEGKVLVLPPVSQDELLAYYQAARLFVLPSIYEGCGIAALEAMACGTPVVVSGGGALPETVGEGALIVEDPLDVEGLAAAMKRALSEEGLRARLREKGLQRARALSGQEAARRLLELYQKLAP